MSLRDLNLQVSRKFTRNWFTGKEVPSTPVDQGFILPGFNSIQDGFRTYNLTYWKGEKRKRKGESIRYLLSKKLLTASEILYMAIAKPLRYDSPLKIQHPGLGAPYFVSEHLSVNTVLKFLLLSS